MFSFVHRCCLVVGVLVFLTACSRSHIPLQFAGSESYYGGISGVDTAVEQFNQTHEFEHVELWLYDLTDLQPSDMNGNPITTWTFDYDQDFQLVAGTLQFQIATFYELNFYEHGNYHRVKSDKSRDDYSFDLVVLNRDNVVERLIHGEVIGEDFLVIDVY